MTFNAGGNAVDAVEAQTSLESVLKDEIIRMYQEVADSPNAEFHFYHGREFRVLKPGGRISITDIVSGRQLSQSIVNDPKLWAS